MHNQDPHPAAGADGQDAPTGTGAYGDAAYGPAGAHAPAGGQYVDPTGALPRDPDGYPAEDDEPRRRRWGAVGCLGGGLIGLIALGGILYGVDYFMSEGQVPRGVTVGGVDIGGLDQEQAEQRLRNNLEGGLREPVTVVAGNMSSVIDPAPSGLNVDWGRTVDQAGRQPLNPVTRVRSFFEKREVGIVSRITDAPLNRTLDRVGGELQRDPSDAALSIGPDGRPDITDDVPGQTVDPAVLSTLVRENWLNTSHTVTVPADVVEAALRRSAADAAVRDVVSKVTASPVVFHGRDGVNGVLQPTDMSRIVTFDPAGDHFTPNYHRDVAQGILSAQLASTETQFRNATFTAQGGGLAVVPSQDGTEIVWDRTLDPLDQKLLDVSKRDWDVTYEDRKATYTTEMAQKATFDDVMGTFTTGGFTAASGTNIRRVAEQVNGAIVLPGETFSLNGYTGPRGSAQGYVESGIILDGHADKAVGGGISQFATTLYNASYFAGMDDVAHTPHSYYISRYPAGREATVYEGAIDLQFKNPFDTPVMITATAGADSVTVELRGVRHVTVDSQTGPKTNFTDPPRRELSGPTCSPSSGERGFTVTDTRTVRDLTGRQLSRKTTTTTYDPAPIVTCKP